MRILFLLCLAWNLSWVCGAPSMGWMSWMPFSCNVQCSGSVWKWGRYWWQSLTSTASGARPFKPGHCLSEWHLREVADAMVDQGYRDAGYTGVHVDDCFLERERGPAGELVASKDRFPSGMKALGDYVHDNGLMYGLYTSTAIHTCAGYPGSGGHEVEDARQFAEWGADYLKADCCGYVWESAKSYPILGAALKASGRNITYACSHPAFFGPDEAAKPWDMLLGSGCTVWRNFHDIECNWKSVVEIMDHWGDQSRVLQSLAASPNLTNDPDMLLVGTSCITTPQARTQFAIWCIVKAPLIMGNDPRYVREEHRQILLNEEAIAISQDSLGIAGIRVSGRGNTEVWARTLSNGDVAVAAVHKDGRRQAVGIHVDFQSVGLHPNGRFMVRDVWAKEPLGVVSNGISVKVGLHDTALLRISLV